ncbi:MAG TPA: TM2 domain-containing protein [Verrucomicrobiae bacterium]
MSDKIPGAEKKLVAGLLAIFVSPLALHKFYLGYTKVGIIQIIIVFCTCGLGAFISIIEGVIYLSKSDEDFVNTYIKNKKGWF